MSNTIKGGPDTEAIKSGHSNSAKSLTVTLSFANDTELFDRLSQEADDDERTLAKYIVRKLRNI